MLGIQSLGCGGGHAQIIAALLNIPNSHKLPKVFLAVESYVAKASLATQKIAKNVEANMEKWMMVED